MNFHHAHPDSSVIRVSSDKGYAMATQCGSHLWGLYQVEPPKLYDVIVPKTTTDVQLNTLFHFGLTVVEAIDLPNDRAKEVYDLFVKSFQGSCAL